MKIHTCYPSFGKAATPPYPAFKLLLTSKLHDGVAYDVYSFATTIKGKYQVHTEYVRQNQKIDIESVAKEGFAQWLR